MGDALCFRLGGGCTLPPWGWAMKGLLAMLQIAICLVAFLGIVNVSIVTAYDRSRVQYKFGMSEKVTYCTPWAKVL